MGKFCQFLTEFKISIFIDKMIKYNDTPEKVCLLTAKGDNFCWQEVASLFFVVFLTFLKWGLLLKEKEANSAL